VRFRPCERECSFRPFLLLEELRELDALEHRLVCGLQAGKVCLRRQEYGVAGPKGQPLSIDDMTVQLIQHIQQSNELEQLGKPQPHCS